MIILDDISKGFWINGVFRNIISNVSFEFPTKGTVGLLGKNGAGKSTLLQIIAGTMRPTSGRVHKLGTISWPIGNANSFHKDMTGAQNTRFLARAYGIDSDDLVAFVEDFAEIGEHFHMPLRSYSSGMRSRLAFGVAMGIPFDMYLIDEVTAVGDATFKAKSREALRARTASAGAIMISHSMSDMRNFCSSGIVMHNGKLQYFADIEHAILKYQLITARAKVKALL